MNVSSTDIALKCTCQKENITDVFVRKFFFFFFYHYIQHYKCTACYVICHASTCVLEGIF